MFGLELLIPLVSAAVGLGSSAFGAYSDYQAGKRNEKRIRAETAEEARRMEAEKNRQTGLARAKAAASGAGMGGSQGMFVGELESDFAGEINWLKRAGAGRAREAARAGTTSAITGMGSGIAAAGSTLGTLDSKDWNTIRGWGG